MSRNAEVAITSDMLLRAYARGIFPMAESADDPTLYWFEPERRGILPLDAFHVPKRLARTVRSEPFSIVCNRDFDAVIAGCGAPRSGANATWINARIRALYGELFMRGHCHTVEAYDGEALVGGLYGVSLGAAFFGESMFHRATDASKIALVHLVARLRAGGFRLLDTQFVTGHLGTFGAIEIPKRRYQRLLDAALEGVAATFTHIPPDISLRGAEALRLAAAGSEPPSPL